MKKRARQPKLTGQIIRMLGLLNCDLKYIEKLPVDAQFDVVQSMTDVGNVDRVAVVSFCYFQLALKDFFVRQVS